MLVEDKFFNQDKNYLMKTVQAFSKDSLLDEWLKQVIHSYNLLHNPMGLQDDFYIHLINNLNEAKPLLADNYDIIAAIYRYHHTDNQLEFMWDGRTHMQRYDDDWKIFYRDCVSKLTLIKEIQRPIIKYTSQKGIANTQFLSQGIKRAILNYFNVKLKKRKGVISISA